MPGCPVACCRSARIYRYRHKLYKRAKDVLKCTLPVYRLPKEHQGTHSSRRFTALMMPWEPACFEETLWGLALVPKNPMDSVAHLTAPIRASHSLDRVACRAKLKLKNFAERVAKISASQSRCIYDYIPGHGEGKPNS